jgi:hypothetical protein
MDKDIRIIKIRKNENRTARYIVLSFNMLMDVSKILPYSTGQCLNLLQHLLYGL